MTLKSGLERQLADLQAAKDGYDARLRQAMKAYDTAPDGSQQKQDAVERMKANSDLIHALERQMSALIDELIELD